MSEEEPKQITYFDVLSHEEHATPEGSEPQVDFRKSDVIVLYVSPPEGLGMYPKSIGKIIGIQAQSVSSRLHRANIPTRPTLADPEAEQRRIEGLRRDWRENREARLAATQSPEARKRRADAVKSAWNNSPQWQDQFKRAHDVWVDQHKESSRKRRETTLRRQEAERERRAKANIQRALSILQDPGLDYLSLREQAVLRSRYRADGQPPISMALVGLSLGGISREAVSKIEKKALAKLERRRSTLQSGQRAIVRRVR